MDKFIKLLEEKGIIKKLKSTVPQAQEIFTKVLDKKADKETMNEAIKEIIMLEIGRNDDLCKCFMDEVFEIVVNKINSLINNDKITLEEFFNSNETLAIHCDTEEKANKLLTEFDKLGKKWRNGSSYLEYNNWKYYKEKTVYYNNYAYAGTDYAISEGHKIYEFEQIILEGENK